MIFEFNKWSNYVFSCYKNVYLLYINMFMIILVPQPEQVREEQETLHADKNIFVDTFEGHRFEFVESKTGRVATKFAPSTNGVVGLFPADFHFTEL